MIITSPQVRRRRAAFSPEQPDEGASTLRGKMKRCPRCRKFKSTEPGRSEFYHSATRADGWSGWCKACDKRESTIYKRDVYRKTEKGLENSRRWGRNSQRRLKLEVLQALGGKCKCCGERREEFLTVDHIGGGGNVHRKILKGRGSQKVYLDIKRQGFPEDKFRILCWNCNMAIAHFGYCPHGNLKEPLIKGGSHVA